MIKKFTILIAAVLFFVSSAAAYAATTPIDEPISKQPLEKTKDRAARAMNNILYGVIEMPNNIDLSKTKGKPIENCTDKTKSGFECGIARLFIGTWQLATFWYSDPFGTKEDQPAAKDVK